jgi:UbiD family decarboxylase
MMEHRIAEPSPSVAPAKDGPQANWRDLREWLALIERNGELQRVDRSVDTNEELSAITYMATRNEKARALLFENLAGDKSGSRVLANMLGSSKERYALAVGLDPDLSTAEMIAETRGVMSRRIPPKRIPKSQAAVNEVVLRGDDIDLTQFPAPKFWPGDGGRYIGTGDITLTASPDTGRINVGCYRQMLHGPRRVGLYCSPGKHGLLDREAWWKQGKPCEVVVAYGIDPVLFMLAAQVFGSKESEFDVAGGIMGRGIELTDGEAVSLPIPAQAELVIEGVVTQGDVELGFF